MNPEAELEHISKIAAEMRAPELVRALRSALEQAPRWRPTARQLLHEIDAGIVEEPRG